MANTRISDLTASASNLAASDLVPVVQTPSVGPVKMTGTQIKTGIIGAGSVSIASGKTFTASNTLTLAGTDSTTITFGSASSSFPIVTSPTAATLQLGAADVASGAVAQTLQVQSNTGAADGPDFTIKGSNSGAANTGGNINFQLADAGAYSTQLYLRTDKVAVFGSSTSSAFNVQVRQSSSGITVSNNGGATTARMTGDRTGSGGGARIHVGSNAEIGWNDATTLTSSAFDTILTRGGAAATLQLGAADTTGTTAPTPQFLRVQSWSSSTNNNQLGADFTIQGSRGTGTGAGGSIIFQVAPAGGSSNGVQNAYSTALTINSASQFTFAAGSASSPTLRFSTAGWLSRGGNWAYSDGANRIFEINGGGFGGVIIEAAYALGFVNDGSVNAPDVFLRRDASNTLALRNGTSAQRFNVYNTYTSSTNYETFKVDWITTANTCLIGTEKGSGGGTARALALQTDGAARVSFFASDGGFTSDTATNTTSNAISAGAWNFRNTNTSQSAASGAALRLAYDPATTVTSASRLGVIAFAGARNSLGNVIDGALIEGTPTQSWSNGSAYGTKVVFSTITSSATALSAKFTIGDSIVVADGILTQFGGATSSFPALKRSTTALQVRLADDSAFGSFQTGGFSGGAPTIKTANYTQLEADYSLIFNGTGSITLTLLAAATYPGKILYVKTIAAQTVVSASSNVKPIDTDTAGTAILAATAGKWAMLQSDGTNWVIMAQG